MIPAVVSTSFLARSLRVRCRVTGQRVQNTTLYCTHCVSATTRARTISQPLDAKTDKAGGEGRVVHLHGAGRRAVRCACGQVERGVVAFVHCGPASTPLPSARTCRGVRRVGVRSFRSSPIPSALTLPVRGRGGVRARGCPRIELLVIASHTVSIWDAGPLFHVRPR